MKKIIHIMHEGRTLCGLTTAPATWPENELWCGLNAKLDDPSHRFCRRCKVTKEGRSEALVPYGKDAPAPDSALARGYQPAGTSDEVIQWLQQRVAYLERELAGAEDRYRQLNGIYTKLADQWNAFQATARPDNRNVHRAEAAGELGRKLAEVLIGLAYDKDVRDLLREVLERLSDEGPNAPRQETPGFALPEGFKTDV